MIAKLVAAAAATLAFAGAAMADPVGHYVVRGTNPGSARPYIGVVVVEKTGDTYRVQWIIGGDTYTGTGIGSDDFLAVAYGAGNQIGLALYNRRSNGVWDGVWTINGGRQIGTDVWTPR